MDGILGYAPFFRTCPSQLQRTDCLAIRLCLWLWPDAAGPRLSFGVIVSLCSLLMLAGVRRYGMFDTLKQRHTRRTGQEPGVLPALSYGVASAFMGQLAAFPLETVTRRLQMQCGPLAGPTFQEMLRQIVREEGPRALYRSVRSTPAIHLVQYPRMDGEELDMQVQMQVPLRVYIIA